MENFRNLLGKFSSLLSNVGIMAKHICAQNGVLPTNLTKTNKGGNVSYLQKTKAKQEKNKNTKGVVPV